MVDSLIKKSNKKEKVYHVSMDEFTPRHFWLEVAEVAIAILISQVVTYYFVKYVYPFLYG